MSNHVDRRAKRAIVPRGLARPKLAKALRLVEALSTVHIEVARWLTPYEGVTSIVPRLWHDTTDSATPFRSIVRLCHEPQVLESRSNGESFATRSLGGAHHHHGSDRRSGKWR